MTAIISIGFKTEAFVAGGGKIPAFSHTPAPNDFDRLIDTVKNGLRDSGHIIALSSDAPYVRVYLMTFLIGLLVGFGIVVGRSFVGRSASTRRA